MVGRLEVSLFRSQRTLHEITRNVTKHEPFSCGFVDRAFSYLTREWLLLLKLSHCRRIRIVDCSPPSRAWKSNHKVTKKLNRIQAVTNCLSVLVSSCLSG